MIRVVLPQHLRTLAQTDREVTIEVQSPVTIAAILNALEVQYPKLGGAIRDYSTHQRRPLVRFFACEEDWSHSPTDSILPPAIAEGKEAFYIIGAIAGG